MSSLMTIGMIINFHQDDFLSNQYLCKIFTQDKIRFDYYEAAQGAWEPEDRPG